MLVVIHNFLVLYRKLSLYFGNFYSDQKVCPVSFQCWSLLLAIHLFWFSICRSRLDSMISVSCLYIVYYVGVLFLVLIRTGFHEVGKSSISSRVFRWFGPFSFSMASLIIVLVLCSMLVMTLSKSMLWDVALISCFSDDVRFSIRTTFWYSSFLKILRPLVWPLTRHVISYTRWFFRLIFVNAPGKMLFFFLWVSNFVAILLLICFLL